MRTQRISRHIILLALLLLLVGGGSFLFAGRFPVPTPDLEGARLPTAFRRPAAIWPPPSPSLQPASVTDYVICSENAADVVLVVSVSLAGLPEERFSFPIRAVLSVPEISHHSHEFFRTEAYSADDPVNGTGVNASVSAFPSSHSVDVTVDCDWDLAPSSRFSLHDTFSAAYGATYERALRHAVVRARFRAPVLRRRS